MRVLLRKLKTLSVLLRLFLRDCLRAKPPCPRKPGTLLLVKLDAIGDYLLFRNFLPLIRESERFRDYRITLCGNEIWRDLAESWDAPYLDHFIWLDRNRFFGDDSYRYAKMQEINLGGFEVVLQSSYAREFFYGDALVRASGASETIGQYGDSRGLKGMGKLISNRYYSRLIRLDGGDPFEFYRNRDFFSQLLQREIPLVKPVLELAGAGSPPAGGAPYAVIFPGAADSFRRWPTANFAAIADFLWRRYRLESVIAGSAADRELAREIEAGARSAPVRVLAGAAPLSELPRIIASSQLLVSNDTGAVHCAVALGARVVCVSNGNHFGRFHPYPAETGARANFVYPPQIAASLGDPEQLRAAYGPGSTLDIATVAVPRVEQAIVELLSRDGVSAPGPAEGRPVQGRLPGGAP